MPRDEIYALTAAFCELRAIAEGILLSASAHADDGRLIDLSRSLDDFLGILEDIHRAAVSAR